MTQNIGGTHAPSAPPPSSYTYVGGCMCEYIALYIVGMDDSEGGGGELHGNDHQPIYD